MLIVTRRPGEALKIGDNVTVTIIRIKGNQVKIGIDAPKDIPVWREEIGGPGVPIGPGTKETAE